MNPDPMTWRAQRAAEYEARGALRSAVTEWREAIEQAPRPAVRLFCTYSLGVLFWGRAGDGVEARRLFEQVDAAGRRLMPIGALPPQVRELVANARENLMILSLSYGEYESWAARLRELQPVNDILRGQAPRLRELREEGHPWSEVMHFGLAAKYYDRSDARHDAGRYGPARSILHLLLAHRIKLRLPRRAWAAAVTEFAALTHRIGADCRRVGAAPEEFAFLFVEAISLAEQYTAAHPSDRATADILDSLRTVLHAP